LCAIFQKSDVALVIKATVFIAFGAFGGEAQLANVAKTKASKQISLYEVDLFMAKVSCKKTPTVKPDARTPYALLSTLSKRR